jgi:hypothetical protein
VRVNVDEPWCDSQAGCVDNVLGRAVQRADSSNAPIADAYVGANRGRTRTVDDVPTTNEKVNWL